MGRDKQYPADLTPDIEANAKRMIAAANCALSTFYADCPAAKHRKVRSGWRPPSVNAAVTGAAAKSKHMAGKAVDLDDDDRELARWCMKNEAKLKVCGILAMERPQATPSWVHWQTAPVGSGTFFFWPTNKSYDDWVAAGQPRFA